MTTKSLYSLFILLLFAACQGNKEQSMHSTRVIINDSDSVALPIINKVRDTAVIAERHRKTAQEMDYYLSRHNVDDEGFDMVARYAQKGDSLLATYMPQRNHHLAISIRRWATIPRQGMGLEQDTLGRLIIGTWQGDTLSSGIRLDSTGIYAGQFCGQLAVGHGSERKLDGSYYEGHFENDLREGFGFCVSPLNLQAGTWRAGRFLGERMHYTSDRIYGIDISRYQHEQGRKRFSINWKQMRITSLGHRTKKRISGTVDYPVRFIYIKSTESTMVRNRYFATDYLSARRQNIPVGAYHFFSTRQSGTAQAQFFLKNTTLRRGDLPPMLDIEPSDAQIAKMGGAKALFREVRAWIALVEKRTKTRPLLYINQRFVDKYLVEAPDLKRDYQVWIARYGEYKPDVHLALWQLSADGRVAGIRGDVDINVFNGYDVQFEEFLREETIQ